MPSFGLDGVLKSNEIKDVASFVRSLSGLEKTNENGAKIFANNCIACHGNDGKGNKLTALLGEAKALEAIKSGEAKQDW